MEAPHSFAPCIWNQLGSHHSILPLCLDEEVGILDLINELFLAAFSLRTRRAAQSPTGHRNRLWVGLLPVLPVSQGLNMGLGRLGGFLYGVSLLGWGR